jgi:hypothetical protein
VERSALAAVCGANIEGLPEGSGRAPAFAVHLLDVIARYQFDAFFARDARYSINGIDVRPRGFDYRASEVEKEDMAEWRRAYKALPHRPSHEGLVDVSEQWNESRWCISPIACPTNDGCDDHLALPRRHR